MFIIREEIANMVTISVCVGSACHVKGSYNVLNSFQQLIEEYKLADKIDLKAVFCLGHCTERVSVKIGEDKIHSVSGTTARSFFEEEIIPLVG
jgi:NADH:ubiquinone oxidoreductase subunit E